MLLKTNSMIKKIVFLIALISLSLPVGIASILGFNYFIYPHKIAIMQSYTDDKSSGFVIVSKQEKLTCEVFPADVLIDSSQMIKANEIKKYTYEHSSYTIHHCDFNDLREGIKYQLFIFDDNNKVIDSRFFKTLSTSQNHFTIAIESCTSDLFHIPLLWDNLKSHNPDYLFMIGDNVYADLFHFLTTIDEPHLWYRYVHSWLVFKIFQQKELTPILAIWDDHDYGQNNADSKYKSKEFSKKLFRTFFNQNKETKNLNQGPGVSFSFSWKRNHFIFFDDRYFRDPNEIRNGNYFSQEQISWLKEKLQKNSNDHFWLISGNQWFSTPQQDESFENSHPESLKDFLNQIEVDKHKVVLVSGDAHMSEIKKIDYSNSKKIYEITSSGMHVYPMNDLDPDKRRIAATNKPNFMITRIDFDKNNVIEVSDYTLFNIKNFSDLIYF